MLDLWEDRGRGLEAFGEVVHRSQGQGGTRADPREAAPGAVHPGFTQAADPHDHAVRFADQEAALDMLRPKA